MGLLRNKVRICDWCGVKRFGPNEGSFLCEICLYKRNNKPTRVFEPAVRQQGNPYSLKYQDGFGKFRPWLREGSVKVTELKELDYEVYLRSEAWALKRREVFDLQGKTCLACGRTKDLHVHHVTYVRLGHESLDDLRVLCHSCHDELHKGYEEHKQKRFRKKWRSLEAHTDRFIERKRKQYKTR